MTPEDIIDTLGLEPHPEGGWFRETFRAVSSGCERSTSTAIYYMLKADEQSRWHRVVDADEIWNRYAGGSPEVAVGRRAWPRGAHLGRKYSCRRASAGGRSEGCLAVGPPARLLGACWLYCRPGLSVRGLRDGAGWVGAGTWLRRRRPTTFLRSCLRAAD